MHTKRRQVTAEIRAVTQVNGVQKAPDFLAANLTTVDNNDLDSGAVQKPPPLPQIAPTPPSALSPPAQPLRKRRQPPPSRIHPHINQIMISSFTFGYLKLCMDLDYHTLPLWSMHWTHGPHDVHFLTGKVEDEDS